VFLTDPLPKVTLFLSFQMFRAVSKKMESNIGRADESMCSRCRSHQTAIASSQAGTSALKLSSLSVFFFGSFSFYFNTLLDTTMDQTRSSCSTRHAIKKNDGTTDQTERSPRTIHYL
jgi:hypothetical protein